MARQSAFDAEKWDRTLGRAAAALCALSGNDSNKEDDLEIFTTRPDTLFGAKFMALSPDHPLAQAAAKNRNSPPLSNSAINWAPPKLEIEHSRKALLRHPAQGAAPVRFQLETAGLCGQFHFDGLWHRCDFRLSGARSTRSRFRQQVWTWQYAGGLPAQSGSEDFRLNRRRLDGEGRMINSGVSSME